MREEGGSRTEEEGGKREDRERGRSKGRGERGREGGRWEHFATRVKFWNMFWKHRNKF